jgi:hypothetical protein
MDNMEFKDSHEVNNNQPSSVQWSTYWDCVAPVAGFWTSAFYIVTAP